MSLALFSATAIAFYAGHHVGDYWVQTDAQAKQKGEPGRIGRVACIEHVCTYVATQVALASVLFLIVGVGTPHWWGLWGAALVSGVTHYMADRREHGLMLKLARRLPGKAAFVDLGKPRAGSNDNPQLATGAWALDQSWHIFWGVFVAALIASI
jgi:hypothetical protein